MILSTKGRYAVMAMVDLALQPEGQPVGLAKIAERQEIPLGYLEQIFSRLKRAGLVQSVRGPGGGYRLARAREHITIEEIMLASEESIEMARCKGDSGCTVKQARCLTHDLWEGLSAQIHFYLGTIFLSDICNGTVQQKFPRAHANAEFMRFAKEVIRVESRESSKENVRDVPLDSNHSTLDSNV